MEDIYDRYKRMNFAELRKYLKDQRTLQKLFYIIPAIVSVLSIMQYCLSGWGKYPAMINEMSQSKTISADLETFGVFDWILCLLMIPLLPYEKTHIKFDFASCIIFGAFNVVKLLFDMFDPFCWAMVVYFGLAGFVLRGICKRIVFLKSLPDYPFTAAVELERQRDLEVQKYSENNMQTRKLMKEEQKKVEGTLDEKMELLPKRKIEEYKISRGDFDDTEQEYTDKLIGEDLKRGCEPTDFEEINEDYREDFSTEDKLTMERGERIDEIDEEYDKDFDATSASGVFGADRFEKFEETEVAGALEMKVKHITYAEFEETTEDHTDELYGTIKQPDRSLDEKPKGYKPVV